MKLFHRVMFGIFFGFLSTTSYLYAMENEEVDFSTKKIDIKNHLVEQTKSDFFERLPKYIFLEIMRYLDLKSICNTRLLNKNTNKRMSKLNNLIANFSVDINDKIAQGKREREKIMCHNKKACERACAENMVYNNPQKVCVGSFCCYIFCCPCASCFTCCALLSAPKTNVSDKDVWIYGFKNFCCYWHSCHDESYLCRDDKIMHSIDIIVRD